MYKNLFKRLFDLVFAIIALPLWLIIFFIVGPIIYIEDKSPIFYTAPRLGKDGKVFKMYKFRSMKVNAPDIRNEDGSTFNSADDPRLTKIGKFIREISLDETPQLLNIIKGDMSIIGPRPVLPDAYNIFIGDEHRILEVLPGLTGYSQAYTRNAASLHERLRQDIYYVDHISFALDINILIKTISSVILKKGVYSNSEIRDGDEAL